MRLPKSGTPSIFRPRSQARLRGVDGIYCPAPLIIILAFLHHVLSLDIVQTPVEDNFNAIRLPVAYPPPPSRSKVGVETIFRVTDRGHAFDKESGNGVTVNEPEPETKAIQYASMTLAPASCII